MKIILLALSFLASGGAIASAPTDWLKDCSSPRFAPGYFLLSSKLDQRSIARIADQIVASDALHVVEIVDHIIAIDGTSHPFSGLVIQSRDNQTPVSQEHSRVSERQLRAALLALSQIPETDLACLSSESIQSGKYIGI